MNKGVISARKVACQAVFALGCFVFIQLMGVRSARAESPRKLDGFEALGTLGYGAPVGDLTWHYKDEIREFDPYGVMLGLDIGYTLPFGLRIGADATRGFGRKREQTLSTGEAVVTHADSFAWGGSLGYDLLLSSFRLRGAADMGLVFIDVENRPGGMWYLGPKVALLWQYRALELGLQTKYWVTSADGPGNNGVFQVQLMSGVRFF